MVTAAAMATAPPILEANTVPIIIIIIIIIIPWEDVVGPELSENPVGPTEVALSKEQPPCQTHPGTTTTTTMIHLSFEDNVAKVPTKQLNSDVRPNYEPDEILEPVMLRELSVGGCLPKPVDLVVLVAVVLHQVEVDPIHPMPDNNNNNNNVLEASSNIDVPPVS